jgi:hypothetical protein
MTDTLTETPPAALYCSGHEPCELPPFTLYAKDGRILSDAKKSATEPQKPAPLLEKPECSAVLGDPNARNQLPENVPAGTVLKPGDYFRSPGCMYYAVLQDDCNWVGYDYSVGQKTMRWSTNTVGNNRVASCFVRLDWNHAQGVAGAPGVASIKYCLQTGTDPFCVEIGREPTAGSLKSTSGHRFQLKANTMQDVKTGEPGGAMSLVNALDWSKLVKSIRIGHARWADYKKLASF